MRKTAIARRRLNAARVAREQSERAELVRLCGLESRWLARALLRMVRELRIADQADVQKTGKFHLLYWQLVPELAWRLGETTLRTMERTDPEIRNLTDSALRRLIAETWKSCAADNEGAPEHMLYREETTGNPLIIALDRLCAPRRKDAATPAPRGQAHMLEMRDGDGRWSLTMLA